MSIFIKENLSRPGICRFICRPVDDEDGDDIFKPERRFSHVFKTFVNYGCAKIDIRVLVFKFLAFLEIPEILETHAHKKVNLQHNCKIKLC